MSLEVGGLPSPTGPFSPSHNKSHFDLNTNTSSSSKVSMSSRFRDLVRFLSSVSGDLSNVTAPPFFLAPSSVVEVGHCWAQRPGVFASPALEPEPARRSLLVLRMILIAMRDQFYVAGSPTVSIKKPLNAFLGELFLASWTHNPDQQQRASSSGSNNKLSKFTSLKVTKREKEAGKGALGLGMDCSSTKEPATVRLVAEQVSHHPPITAMALLDTTHGIRADGYARVEMTFSTSVDIRQIGHAILTIERHNNETYLLPLPDVKVRGFLSGRLYPEVLGTYTIVSSTGYVSELTFSGAGVFRGKKNTFSARLYHRDAPETTLYDVAGCWSEGWTVRDGCSGDVLEVYDVEAPANQPAPMDLPPREKQDPWESRRAWSGVAEGLERGDFRAVVAEKTKLEQAQRRMRAEEKEKGEVWEPLLFRNEDGGKGKEVFEKLAEGMPGWELNEDKTKGVWRLNDEKVSTIKRPFREGVTPLG